MSTNENPTTGNAAPETEYRVPPAYRAAMLESLRTNGLIAVDGRICWIEPGTGAVLPADPEWFLSCGIDLRMHIRPMLTGEADHNTRMAQERLLKWFKQHTQNEKIRDDLRGKFVFMVLNPGPGAVKPEDIDYATLARLAVLGGNLQYHGRKKKSKEETQTVPENFIMRAERNGRVKATKKDIRKILQLPSATWEQFWTTCTEKGYITGSDDTGYSMAGVFRYGSLDRQKSTRMQKIYIDALKRLYYFGYVQVVREDDEGKKWDVTRTIKNSDHKTIGMLLRLAATCMHPETNELCDDPGEKDQFRLKPLDDRGLAKALGYDLSHGHAARDIQKLRNLTFCATADGPEMYCLVKTVVVDGSGRKTARYIINPELVYAGTREHYRTMLKAPHWYVDPEDAPPQKREEDDAKEEKTADTPK